jgi:hypothetical protein
MMHTTVLHRLPAGWYREPEVEAPSAQRRTTLRVEVPAGKSRGFQSVFRNPAVTEFAEGFVATIVLLYKYHFSVI